MSWSLLLHARWRPYADTETNILAILFCSCDLLGALASFKVGISTQACASCRFTFQQAIQTVFIFSTLMTLIIVGVLATRAVREQAKKSKTGLKNQSTKDLFSSYTSLEKKLLFPVLFVVWISVRFFHLIHCSRTKGVNQENGNMEEKISQGNVDDDISSWGREKRNNTKITPLTKNQEDSSKMYM